MLLFSKNIQRQFAKIPRPLPLNSTLMRFKIWQTDEQQKKINLSNKLYSVSVETGELYLTLDQVNVKAMKKDLSSDVNVEKNVNYPYSNDALKTHIVHEHILNGEPSHIITLSGLNPNALEKQLRNIYGSNIMNHRFGKDIYTMIGMSLVPIHFEKNMREFLENLITSSGIESILKQPLKDKCETGLVQALIQAEKIQQNLENPNQTVCKK